MKASRATVTLHLSRPITQPEYAATALGGSSVELQKAVAEHVASSMAKDPSFVAALASVLSSQISQISPTPPPAAAS